MRSCCKDDGVSQPPDVEKCVHPVGGTALATMIRGTVMATTHTFFRQTVVCTVSTCFACHRITACVSTIYQIPSTLGHRHDCLTYVVKTDRYLHSLRVPCISTNHRMCEEYLPIGPLHTGTVTIALNKFLDTQECNGSGCLPFNRMTARMRTEDDIPITPLIGSTVITASHNVFFR